MPQLSYAIVVATRNRLAALQLSLPRMLTQSRSPAQLVVVDSSDDHAVVADAVRHAAANWKGRLTILQSERGLTLQRNRGLALVDHPIVFFPDDDSIWFAGAAEAILAVYERDNAGALAAVCAIESQVPPDDFSVTNSGYTMSRSDRLKQSFIKLRSAIEHRLFPDPGRVLGRAFMQKANPPTWLREVDAAPVEWMTGFRMSFRTKVIAACRFDETLARYCLFEDRDASFGAWRHGLVVATSAARVYHHRSPEVRDTGWRMGIEQLLNQAYITAKYSEVGAPSRQSVMRFARYKTFLYSLTSRSAFGRGRYLGAKSTLAELPALVASPSSEADKIYLAALARCLARASVMG
jgi:glycosyltransferase involved in cell wall biosynthesis